MFSIPECIWRAAIKLGKSPGGGCHKQDIEPKLQIHIQTENHKNYIEFNLKKKHLQIGTKNHIQRAYILFPKHRQNHSNHKKM